MGADSMVIDMGDLGIQSIGNFHKPKDLECCLASIALRLLLFFSAEPGPAQMV